MRSATAVAARMLGYWSMGDTVASHGVSKLAIVGGSAATAEDGTDRNFLETDLGKRVEEKLQAMLRGHHGAPAREPHPDPGGRARARDRTGRSPATTSRPSSRARRGRSWTAGRIRMRVRRGHGALPRGGARGPPRTRRCRPVDAVPALVGAADAQPERPRERPRSARRSSRSVPTSTRPDRTTAPGPAVARVS